MNLIYPKEYQESVLKIDYEKLYNNGYRGIIFDIDNTLAPYNVEHPSKDIRILIAKLHKMGFLVALASNNTNERVSKFNRFLKIRSYANALKPLTINLNKCRKDMKLKKNQMVMVGDQMFTDVVAGNAIGFYSILVEPIQKKEQFITSIKRGIEGVFIKRFLSKNSGK